MSMNQNAAVTNPGFPELLSGTAGFVAVFTARWAAASVLLVRGLTVELGAAGVPVVTVDVDANPQYADQFSVVSVPTVVVFSGADERRRFTGATTPASVASAVDDLGLTRKKARP